MFKFILTLILGFAFGSILLASQVFSWFRIQEMFHFQSFHMFGLLFSAIGTSALFLFIIKKMKIKSIQGNQIEVKPKKLELKANIIGGLIFGLGWSISGACSAPVYILVGLHWQIGLILLAGAFTGTVIYGAFINKLPR
ncbi:MAG: hypothetical protein RI883_1840 [Bacteroidota bacterium]